MAHFKSEGEVHDHNYIPTSALLLSRRHFGTHFEGRADHTHYAAPAAEYNVWCKSEQGFPGTWASVGSARSEICDTLLTE